MWCTLHVINYLCGFIDTEKELLSKLKEKDQEIEIVKDKVTSLTPEDKIIQQGSTSLLYVIIHLVILRKRWN